MRASPTDIDPGPDRRSRRGASGGLDGTGGGRVSRRRRREEARTAIGGGRLDFGPRPMAFESRSGDEPTIFAPRKRRLRLDIGAILAGAFGIGTLVFVGSIIYRTTRVEVEAHGIADGASLNANAAEHLAITMDVGGKDRAAGATVTFDGKRVKEPKVDGSVVVWRPDGDLKEGDHKLELSVSRPVLGDATFTWDFTVDTTAPEVDVAPVAEPVGIDQGGSIEGTTEPGSTLSADGRDLEVDDKGRFRLDFSRPPAGSVSFRATDRARNVTSVDVIVPVSYPAARAVHMTAASWDSTPLRDGVLRLLDERRIDTVVIDLKDQDGVVGYDTTVTRAREIGAVTTYYDLEDVVGAVEAHGGRVVGRISAFRDPILAQAAWNAGLGDQVIQTTDGRPYEGEFTNFASAAVRRYNLDIALDAVNRGVDDILWDDARKPGGDIESMLVPGLSGSPEDALVAFLAEAHTELRRRGAFQGVATSGIAVTDGSRVAQDVARLARNADYLVPTIHPAYWNGGEFGVPNPPTQPYDLVFRVLERYQQLAEGTGTAIVPSLQDFTAAGVGYGDAEVRAELDAARARGAAGFLLWDPSVTYHGGALDPAA
jgi:hypothetical protein